MAQKVKDEDLLYLCLCGKTQKEISKALRITPATVNRRINTPQFKDMLSDYRNKAIENVLTNLTAVAGKAVSTLTELLDDNSPYIRLKACSKVLELVQDYNLQTDIIRDVEDLKARKEKEEDEL